MLSMEQNGVLRVPLSQSASESKSSLKAEKKQGKFLIDLSSPQMSGENYAY